MNPAAGRDDPLARLDDEPGVEGGVDHPYTAFNQGWDARDAGHALDLNPYEPGTREHRWWAMGWREHDDDEGPADLPAVPHPPGMARKTRRARRNRSGETT